MARKMSDAKIIDTVIAIDTTLIALFDVLRIEQPAIAMRMADVLMKANSKGNIDLPGALAHIGEYCEVLTRPPTMPAEH